MSRALNDSELAALNVSGTVLRFAAENRQDLDTNIVAQITAALDAKEANTWDQNTATTFWDAYRQLCVLIQPVTVDSLRATREPLAAPNWQVWRLGDSLARRSATRYLTLLIVLLVLAVTLGFLASIQTKLVTEVEKLISSGDELTEKMVAEVDSLDTVIGTRKFSEVTKPGQQGGISNDQIKMISALKSQLTQEDHLITQMLQKTQALVRISSFGFRRYDYGEGNFTPPDDLDAVRVGIQNYYQSREVLTKILLQKSIITNIITTTILPIVLGLMGACAYVVRLISDQIKDNTFSTTSPVRHTVRIALGGLAGVVIGFAGMINLGSLSPSALAFIAGYAIEPVFSTLDGIAAKFRQ